MTQNARDAHATTTQNVRGGEREGVWVDEDLEQPGHVRLHVHTGGRELLTISFAAHEADELGRTLQQTAAWAARRPTAGAGPTADTPEKSS